MADKEKHRRITRRWKHILGTGKGSDRKYTERVNRAIERGQFTEKGTKSN